MHTGCFEFETDIPGDEIFSYADVVSPMECREHCSMHEDCLFFTYNTRSRECSLKATDESKIFDVLNRITGPRVCE